MTLTWITSFGTAIGWNGVFFVSKEAHGFTRVDNLWLGVSMGAAYTVCAWSAGRLMGRHVGRGKRLSTRGFLGLLLAGAAALSVVPVVVGERWALVAYATVYIALCGFVWPTVESYLADGRSGRALRRATGLFNLSWASSLVVAMWVIAPVLEEHPLWVLGVLVPIHLVSIVLLVLFRRNPGEHGSAAHAHTPEELAALVRLRRLFRMCLLGSYVLHAGLSPVLPQMIEGLGVEVRHSTVLASVWMVTRLGVFALMISWHGWHGHARTAVWSGGLMLGGFVLALMSGSWWVLAIGLAMLGVGIGAVYAAAIYYALETGSTDVDAGGKHEAMIGAGYTVGPMLGLALESAVVFGG